MKRLLILSLVCACLSGQDLRNVAQTASGDITSASTGTTGTSTVYLVPPSGTNAVTVQLTGTFVATVQFEATVNGTDYVSMVSTSGATSATGTGAFSFAFYGYRAMRVRCSAFTSGTVSVAINSAAAVSASVGWTDDGATIQAAVGRNVAIGTTVLSPTASVIVPLVVTTGAAGQTVAAAGGLYINDTEGAIAYTLPAAEAGLKICIRNAATRTGAVTVNAPAATTIDKDGAVNSTPGSIASAGALGDSACFVGQAAGKYLFFGGSGTWTNN